MTAQDLDFIKDVVTGAKHEVLVAIIRECYDSRKTLWVDLATEQGKSMMFIVPPKLETQEELDAYNAKILKQQTDHLAREKAER